MIQTCPHCAELEYYIHLLGLSRDYRAYYSFSSSLGYSRQNILNKAKSPVYPFLVSDYKDFLSLKEVPLRDKNLRGFVKGLAVVDKLIPKQI